MLEPLWQWFSDPVNQMVSLAVLVVFFIGFLVGRSLSAGNAKKQKARASEGDRAILKGVQYILSNDHDQAIEELTKSVQVNSDTVETYVALANLYRSKGEIDRAIGIRQNIIIRPHIKEEVKIRALYDLGLDYRKGGFLKRAQEVFLDVIEKQPSNLETLEELEKIYEDLKDWGNAFHTRQKISRLSKGDHKHILAHHQTALGKQYQEAGEWPKAKACFKKAISIHKGCIDAYLHLGDLYFERQDFKKALSSWKEVARVAPTMTFLAYRRLEGAYAQMKNLKPVEEFLKACASLHSDAFSHLALARYLYNERDYDGALRELDGALELNPHFIEARRFRGEILLNEGMKEEALSSYRDLINHLDVPYLKFQCTNCGYQPLKLQWHCPQCRQWDTITRLDTGKSEKSPSEASEMPSYAVSPRESEERV